VLRQREHLLDACVHLSMSFAQPDVAMLGHEPRAVAVQVSTYACRR
jgi:hypothetical protein